MPTGLEKVDKHCQDILSIEENCVQASPDKTCVCTCPDILIISRQYLITKHLIICTLHPSNFYQ